jgi:UDP-N-acetylmuramoyl-tripeptide--D-alanyl-D-alanine ligase
VIEIGMNAPGEIEPLARLARPHVAIVTTVAPVHLAAFASIEGIAREKAAIYRGLVPGGSAVFNADTDWTSLLQEKALAVGARPVSFGTAEGADSGFWTQLLPTRRRSAGPRGAASRCCSRSRPRASTLR